MWSLVKLKNDTKAVFASDLLRKSKQKTHVNIGGLDITCQIIKKSGEFILMYDFVVFYY